MHANIESYTTLKYTLRVVISVCVCGFKITWTWTTYVWPNDLWPLWISRGHIESSVCSNLLRWLTFTVFCITQSYSSTHATQCVVWPLSNQQLFPWDEILSEIVPFRSSDELWFLLMKVYIISFIEFWKLTPKVNLIIIYFISVTLKFLLILPITFKSSFCNVSECALFKSYRMMSVNCVSNHRVNSPQNQEYVCG